MTHTNAYYERKASGLCVECGIRRARKNMITCESCGAKLNLRRTDQIKKMRSIVYEHYGNKCACCGESNVLFLTVDHINNDGAEHRISRNGTNHESGNLYGWLVKHNFPPGFQLLCFNCNLGKHRNGGICPHKTRRK